MSEIFKVFYGLETCIVYISSFSNRINLKKYI